MSNAQLPLGVSVVAGAAVTIYRFVTQAVSDGRFSMVGTAQSVRMDGIAAESVSAAGQALQMVIPMSNIAKVEAGAAVTRGDRIASDASGRAITAVSGVDNWTAGVALDAAGGAGEIIRILFVQDRDQA